MPRKASLALTGALFLSLTAPANAGGYQIGQGQEQIQQQGQTAVGTGGNASAGAGASSDNSVSIEGDNVDPAAYAPSLGSPASGPCTGQSGGLAGGGLGLFSFGVNGSSLDDECSRRENARVLAILGDRPTGLELMYQNSDIARARAVVEQRNLSRRDVSCASALEHDGPESVSYQRCVEHAIRMGQPFMTQSGVVTPEILALALRGSTPPPTVIVQPVPAQPPAPVLLECDHYNGDGFTEYTAC